MGSDKKQLPPQALWHLPWSGRSRRILSPAFLKSNVTLFKSPVTSAFFFFFLTCLWLLTLLYEAADPLIPFGGRTALLKVARRPRRGQRRRWTRCHGGATRRTPPGGQAAVPPSDMRFSKLRVKDTRWQQLDGEDTGVFTARAERAAA